MKLSLLPILLVCPTLAFAQDGVAAVPAQVIAEHPDAAQPASSSAAIPPQPISVTVDPVPIPTPEKVAEKIHDVKAVVKGGDLTAGFAAALMLLVWVLRRVLKDGALAKRPDVIPWVTMILSCSTASLACLAAGFSIYEALMAGLVVGSSANGLWSLLGKHLLPTLPVPPPITFPKGQEPPGGGLR